MTVFIPGPLRSYTNKRGEVEASGATLGELLLHLDSKFPGIRFRIIDEQDAVRTHIKIFVDEEQVRNLDARLRGASRIHIVCALSGG
jgi:molybdopterin converting factor small subunit